MDSSSALEQRERRRAPIPVTRTRFVTPVRYARSLHTCRRRSPLEVASTPGYARGRGNIPASVQAMRAGDRISDQAGRGGAPSKGDSGACRTRPAYSGASSDTSELQDRYDSLPRKQETMRQEISGVINNQVAAQLQITEFTVKFHREHIVRKICRFCGRPGQDGGEPGHPCASALRLSVRP